MRINLNKIVLKAGLSGRVGSSSGRVEFMSVRVGSGSCNVRVGSGRVQKSDPSSTWVGSSANTNSLSIRLI